MRVIVRKTHCRYCDDEFSTIMGLPVCAVRERINRYIIKGFRVPVQEWYFPVASCNNGFMLTAPEIYGIVTAAEKNSCH